MSEDNASAADPGASKVKARYLEGNLAQKFSTFNSEEQDRVRNAFRPTSFTSIQSLPQTYGGPGDYPAGRVSPAPFKAGRAAPLFTEFTYSAEPYSLVDELRAVERMDGQARQQAIAGDQPFRPVGQNFTAKHEGVYPYVPEPFEAVKDEATRQRWLAEKKVLSGAPFLPAGGTKALEKPGRAMLTEILTSLYRLLCEDWEEAQPTVFTTEEDLIVIYFNLALMKSVAGIQAYMNVLEARNEVIRGYQLQKVTSGWGLQTEDNHMMFTFRPPWVRAAALTELSANSTTTP
eukprot:RCo008272